MPQPIDHRQLQIAHPAIDVERQECPVAAQRYDVHPGQMADHFLVDDNQVLAFGNSDQLDVWLCVDF